MQGEVEERSPPLTPEELSRRFPRTHHPLGRFKDDPGYFRRRDRILETEEGRKLRKSLVRRGLPLSWVPLLLRQELKPSKLVQRLRDLEALTTELETIKSRTREIRDRIKSLLRKPNEPVQPIPIAVESEHQPTQSCHTEEVFD